MANLTGANLEEAQLNNANITKANFKDANLEGVIGLSPEQLEQICAGTN